MLADLFALRAEADAVLGGRPPLAPGQEPYPLGCCKIIGDFALRRFLAPQQVDSSRPALAAVAAFRRAGGIVKGL